MEDTIRRIRETPPDILQAALITLCDDEKVKQRTLHLLDLLQAHEAKNPQSPSADTTTPEEAKDEKQVVGKKRKQPPAEIFICENCSEPFFEDENKDDACRFHDGSWEPDDDGDFWAEHDDYHGPIDTAEMREEFPDGFIWDCCNVVGKAEGCQVDRHRKRPC